MLGDEILTLAQLVDGTLGTGNDRHVLTNSRSTRRNLVSKGIDDLGRRTNEDHSVLLDLAGEFGVLREESVTFRDQPQLPLRPLRNLWARRYSPGWIMSTPCWTAILTISSIAR